MKKNLVATAVAFFVMLSLHAQGLTLYVSTTGKDSNPGILQQPLATLEGARDKIRQYKSAAAHPGSIEVIIAPGRYYMERPLLLTAQDGGGNDFRITYRALESGTVTFYGGIALEKFTAVHPALWRCRIPEVRRYQLKVEQLYINDRRAPIARYPDSGFFRVRGVTETILNQGRDSELTIQKILLYPEQADLFKSLSPDALGEALFTFYHKWNTTRKKNLRFSAADTALYMVSGAIKKVNKIDSNTLFVVENIQAALTKPGEWWLQKNGDLYYIPRPGESIEQTEAIAPVNESFLQIAGQKGRPVEQLYFENLAFKATAYTLPVNGDDPKQAAAFTGAAIMVNHARNIHFINCEIAHTGTNAIWFQNDCASGVVQHCYLHDLGAGGVKIGEVQLTDHSLPTHHIQVDNNIIRSAGHVFPCAVGVIIFHASDNRVTHNEIADMVYSGVSVGWIWGYAESRAKRNLIAFNHIHHLGWGLLSDMGAVYTLGPSEGTLVANNVIHDIYAATYGGWGLYTDEGSTGICMENNLVYNCKSGGFHQHYGKDNMVRNNIFFNQQLIQLEASRIEPHCGFTFAHNIVYYSTGNLVGIRWEKVNQLSDYNAYWDTRGRDIVFRDISFADWQKKGQDKHSVIADPRFRDAAGGDFTIGNRKLLRSIRFKPFDVTRAGVYGDLFWKKLATFDPGRAQEFDRIVDTLESERMSK